MSATLLRSAAKEKIGICQFCGKLVGLVPEDATEITCFKCDQLPDKEQTNVSNIRT